MTAKQHGHRGLAMDAVSLRREVFHCDVRTHKSLFGPPGRLENSVCSHVVSGSVKPATHGTPIQGPALAVDCREDRTDEAVHVGTAKPAHARTVSYDGKVVADNSGTAVFGPQAPQKEEPQP